MIPDINLDHPKGGRASDMANSQVNGRDFSLFMSSPHRELFKSKKVSHRSVGFVMYVDVMPVVVIAPGMEGYGGGGGRGSKGAPRVARLLRFSSRGTLLLSVRRADGRTDADVLRTAIKKM